MNARKFFAALLAALFLVAAPALAKVVSPGQDFYYLDNANVLSEALEGEIYFSNALLSEACGAEFVVVTLNTTGNEAIDDYAYELFSNWKIGDTTRDNGFLLLLAIGDDDYYATCGSGLQSKFTSGTLKQYFDRYLESDFAAGNYETGVKKFFEAAFERISDTYNTNVTTAQGIQAYQNYLRQQSVSNTSPSNQSSYGGGNRPQSKRGGIGLGRIILMAILVIVVLRFLKKRRPAKPHSGFNVFGGSQNTYNPRPSGGSSFMKWYLISQLFKSFTNSKPQSHHSNSSFFGTGFGGNSHSNHSSYNHSSHSGGSGFFGGFSSGSSSRPSGGFGGRRTSGGGSTRGGGAGRGRH